MGWVKVENDYFENAKICAVGPFAELIFIRSIAWCSKQNTDGLIPKAVARRLAADLLDFTSDDIPNLLVSHKLWVAEESGFRIHGFTEFQTSRAERESLSLIRAESGRRGAAARWQKQSENLFAIDVCHDGKVDEVADQIANDGKVHSKVDDKSMQRSKKKELRIKKEEDRKSKDLITDVIEIDSIDADFERWWKSYPRKVGKNAARASYLRARRRQTSASMLDSGLANSIALWSAQRVKPEFIPHPTTWLKRGSWTDEEQPPISHSNGAEQILNQNKSLWKALGGDV